MVVKIYRVRYISYLFRKDSVVIYVVPQRIVGWLVERESFKGNTRIVK